VDVINGGAEQAAAIKGFGAADPYESPQRQFFPPELKDKESYFTSLYITPMVLGYNTKLVKPNEAPKTYEDLLNPRWKSGMFLDDEAFEWYAILLRHFGMDSYFVAGQPYLDRLLPLVPAAVAGGPRPVLRGRWPCRR